MSAKTETILGAMLVMFLVGVAVWYVVSDWQKSLVDLDMMKVQESDVQWQNFDREVFTQGLEMVDDNTLAVSSGLYDHSFVGLFDWNTKTWIKKVTVPFFSEGLTILDNKIYSFSWREGVGKVWDSSTLQQLGEWRYEGEGWGMTNDGQYLIVSDGTSVIRYLDPKTFELVKSLAVKFRDKSELPINELEYIDGKIWANVWYWDTVLVIDPISGEVDKVVDLGIITKNQKKDVESVLNGIFEDKSRDRICFGGKNWEQIFCVAKSIFSK
jgi:glutamine cyclotransferase